MAGDIGKIARIELELAGDDVAAVRPLIGRVDIAGEIARPVIDASTRRHIAARLIVERRQDDRRAELAFVDQIAGRLEETVKADLSPFKDVCTTPAS